MSPTAPFAAASCSKSVAVFSLCAREILIAVCRAAQSSSTVDQVATPTCFVFIPGSRPARKADATPAGGAAAAGEKKAKERDARSSIDASVSSALSQINEEDKQRYRCMVHAI